MVLREKKEKNLFHYFVLHAEVSHHVLGLAGIELSFFITTCMVLWFRFESKPVLITQHINNILVIAEQCLHSIEAFLFPTPAPSR